MHQIGTNHMVLKSEFVSLNCVKYSKLNKKLYDRILKHLDHYPMLESKIFKA